MKKAVLYGTFAAAFILFPIVLYRHHEAIHEPMPTSQEEVADSSSVAGLIKRYVPMINKGGTTYTEDGTLEGPAPVSSEVTDVILSRALKSLYSYADEYDNLAPDDRVRAAIQTTKDVTRALETEGRVPQGTYDALWPVATSDSRETTDFLFLKRTFDESAFGLKKR